MKTTYNEIQKKYSKMRVEERVEIFASLMDVDPNNEQGFKPLKQEVKIETKDKKKEGDNK